jgi:hypothetical protein
MLDGDPKRELLDDVGVSIQSDITDTNRRKSAHDSGRMSKCPTHASNHFPGEGDDFTGVHSHMME